MSQLFRKKIFGEKKDSSSGLIRALGLWDIVFFGLAAIIGAGSFSSLGEAVFRGGPGVIVLYVICGFACGFTALCYAEFASRIPTAGSAYTYAYATLGEFFAWLIGWDLALEYLLGASSVAVGWSGYVADFLQGLGVVIPPNWVNAPFDYVNGQWVATGAIVNGPAIIIMVLCTAMLVVGIRLTSLVNNIAVFIKLAVILLLIVFGSTYVVYDNLVPFVPENSGNFGEFGWSGVFRGAGVIFFAYIGFDAVATSAEEAKNPSRDVPIGILGSLAVCTLLYFIVAMVLTGIVPYTQLNNAEPVAYALRVIGYPFGSAIVAVGAICGITTVLLVLLYGQARVFFALSRDGMIPKGICRVHKKYHTPYLVTIGGCILVSLIAGFVPINVIAEMANIGTLSAFFIAGFGVLYLRITRPEIKRGFKCPAIYIVGPMAMLSCGYLMYNLP